MNFKKGKHREEVEINLIPFIDVLLVILIFLMVTTTYSKSTQLHLTLPQANAPRMKDRPLTIQIEVGSDGRYVVNNVVLPSRDVAVLTAELSKWAQVKTGEDDPVVVINADAKTAHQNVVHVLEAAQNAGLAKVTFAAQTANN